MDKNTMENEPGLVLEGDLGVVVDARQSEGGVEMNASNISGDIPAEKENLPVTTENRDLDGASGGRRIGDELIQMGVITPDQLNVALQEKKINGKMLGQTLVDLGFIDSEILSGFLAETSGVIVFDPKATILDTDALSLIDKKMALKHMMLPFALADGVLEVAMVDPYDVVALDTLKNKIPKGIKLNPNITTPNVLNDAIESAYGFASSVKAILKELEGTSEDDLDDITTLDEEQAYSHPLVRLVNALIFEAVKLGASDLHFEPEENFVRLRYRVDGVLVTAQILHKQHWKGISQRIKLLSKLNIADKLSAQDGRFPMFLMGRGIDFRVSTLPTVYGENIVMRVLDKQAGILPLADLGFSEHNLKLIEKAQRRPEGIIIVTGPTGSGKTTSLYSMLNEINTVDVNIQTLEDPVEYNLPMIRQSQVREGILEFADGIRAILRQDPDVILIGEIRDQITAGMALQASMTGHQVYTTLHTNDSLSALPRLYDLGMKPGMLAGSITAIFAQRLARLLCNSCKEPHTATPEELEILGVSNADLFKPKQGGCDQCMGQGYKGRTAIVEIVVFDEGLDDLMAAGANKGEIKKAAVNNGFKTLREDAIQKVLEGKTSLEAISKVVDIHE